MTKKKKRKKTKKVSDSDPSTYQTGVAIVNLWEHSIHLGLVDKDLDDDSPTTFKQPLIDFVQGRLDGNKLTGIPPEVFTKGDEKNTKHVAKDLGKICRMLTKGKTVDPDTFEAAYRLVQNHHDVCRKGAGGGVWCEGGA